MSGRTLHSNNTLELRPAPAWDDDAIMSHALCNANVTAKPPMRWPLKARPRTSPQALAQAALLIGVTLACGLVTGQLVTQRMLGMYKKKQK